MSKEEILLDEKFLPAAINLVSQAWHNIYVTTFKAEITTKPRGRLLRKFFQILCEKSQIGVDTRLILNKVSKMGSVPITNLYAMKELPKQGVAVRHLRNNRICHAKLIIVDNYAALVGSHNLSVKACHNNFESTILTCNKDIVKGLKQHFESLWENSQKP